MERISKIKGYDEYGYEVMEFSLPTMDEATAAAAELSRALASFGLSSRDAAEAIMRVSEALNRIDVVESVLDYRIDSKVSSLKTEVDILKNNNAHNERRIYEVEREISDLRPVLDAPTENPNQNSDLEIFSQIEWDEHFLNFGPSNIFLN